MLKLSFELYSLLCSFDRISARSYACSIERSTASSYRGGLTFSRHVRTDVWDTKRETLVSRQHARIRTRKVIRWRKPPWEAPQRVLPAPRRPDPRGDQGASRRAACP